MSNNTSGGKTEEDGGGGEETEGGGGSEKDGGAGSGDGGRGIMLELPESGCGVHTLMNRGALCAPKDAFPLILRLQSSNDVCTQSGLVLLFVHLRCAPLLFHISCIDITHSPFDVQPLEAQNYHFHKPIDSTSSLRIVLATLLLYLVVCMRTCLLAISTVQGASRLCPQFLAAF